VSGLSGVTDVALGGDHACAIADGAVYCWGNNGNGEVGNSTTQDQLEPVKVLP
jgi:serine/threonine-protein kinase